MGARLPEQGVDYSRLTFVWASEPHKSSFIFVVRIFSNLKSKNVENLYRKIIVKTAIPNNFSSSYWSPNTKR
jgi:hypothetical protein